MKVKIAIIAVGVLMCGFANAQTGEAQRQAIDNQQRKTQDEAYQVWLAQQHAISIAEDNAYVASQKRLKQSQIEAGESNEVKQLQKQIDALESPKAGNMFRVFDGATNYIKQADNGWKTFSGKVLQVENDGVLMQSYGFGNIFIANYPSGVVDDQQITGLAHESGMYSYQSVMGATLTVKKLDYGIAVQPTEEIRQSAINAIQSQIKAIQDGIVERQKNEEAAAAAVVQKQADEKQEKIKAAQDAALKYNEQQAEKGDAYGLLRMGERYRDSDGVEKDLDKAKNYLSKAADAGSTTAANELAQLNLVFQKQN